MKLCFYYFSIEISKNIYSLFTNTSNKGSILLCLDTYKVHLNSKKRKGKTSSGASEDISESGGDGGCSFNDCFPFQN